jgi:serine protease Do
MIAEVTREVAESIGLGKPQGAMVRAVEPSSPAEKAGLEAGDIIVKLDGKPLEKSSDLQRGISAIKPGTKVTLQVFRRGVFKDVSVTVGEFEPEKPATQDGEGLPPAATSSG